MHGGDIGTGYFKKVVAKHIKVNLGNREIKVSSFRVQAYISTLKREGQLMLSCQMKSVK